MAESRTRVTKRTDSTAKPSAFQSKTATDQRIAQAKQPARPVENAAASADQASQKQTASSTKPTIRFPNRPRVWPD